MKANPSRPRFSFLSTLGWLALLLTSLSLVAKADTPAISYTSNNTNFFPADTTAGWTFSLSSAILVTSLGVRDSNSSTFTGTGGADGLGDAHLVTIWTTAGIQVAQATVPAGTGAPLVNGYRYMSLALPVQLLAGNYVIGAYFPTSADVVASLASGITTPAGITYLGERSISGNAFPSGDTGFSPVLTAGYFGPNFQFVVPESESSILFFAGLLVIAILKAPKKLARLKF